MFKNFLLNKHSLYTDIQSQHTCMYTTTGTCISEIQNTGKRLIHGKKGDTYVKHICCIKSICKISLLRQHCLLGKHDDCE